MSDFATDPRYAMCSEQGRGELKDYLQWIKDANLEDTEYAYVFYVLGRARITDARHLFAIWEHQMGGQIDRSTRSQIRRFFMNPSPEISFKLADSAGWFDFIISVYQLVQAVPAPHVNVPVFVKVGFDELPARIRSVKSNIHPESNIQLVSCRYCVDFGKYIFPSQAERDDFIKNPKFIFDFQTGNIDDKKGLIKIFGSTVNISPIYQDNAPKFIITHLEKNEDNDLGAIVSVKVEMAFEVQVRIEEFRDWIDSPDSTWRYSGRIECVGEDGLEDSDREEYEFNW